MPLFTSRIELFVVIVGETLCRFGQGKLFQRLWRDMVCVAVAVVSCGFSFAHVEVFGTFYPIREAITLEKAPYS